MGNQHCSQSLFPTPCKIASISRFVGGGLTLVGIIGLVGLKIAKKSYRDNLGIYVPFIIIFGVGLFAMILGILLTRMYEQMKK